MHVNDWNGETNRLDAYVSPLTMRAEVEVTRRNTHASRW